LTSHDEWIRWFEAAWEHREEVVYRELFGEPEGQGIYVLTPAVFERRFGGRGIDPRWLHHGVLVYPPNDRSGSWKYVTSGLSNAWEDDLPNPHDISGLGTEFCSRHLSGISGRSGRYRKFSLSNYFWPPGHSKADRYSTTITAFHCMNLRIRSSFRPHA